MKITLPKRKFFNYFKQIELSDAFNQIVLQK